MSAAILDFNQGANPTTNAAVTAELWISFVALLRSHLAALQTTGKLARVKLIETSSDTLRMGDLAGNLELTMSLATGTGRYQQQRCGEAPERGLWRLNPDATASIDSAIPIEMEFAVEAFARKLLMATQGEMGAPGENKR